MAEIQAAILNIKLTFMKEWQGKRSTIAMRYDRELKNIDAIKNIVTLNGNVHNYHKYVIRVDDRDNLKQHLSNAGIMTKIHYPMPLHHQPEFQNYIEAKDLPCVEALTKSIISLPIYPELTESEVDYIITSIKEFYL